MHHDQTLAPAGQRSAAPGGDTAAPAADGGAVRGRREQRGGRLVRLTTSCPRCGSRPAMRVTEDLVRGIHTPEELTRIGTYQCHRRGCGTIYDLYVDARLLEAEPGGTS
ncbi:MAG TPA: hypothetical protein VGV85_06655 [Longimicrobiaceae bacterium]|nr:hypothetical protein [Longimicrobiaceae bacterium]